MNCYRLVLLLGKNVASRLRGIRLRPRNRLFEGSAAFPVARSFQLVPLLFGEHSRDEISAQCGQRIFRDVRKSSSSGLL